MSFCPSHAWDSYIDQYPDFLGCPVCHTESENTWVDVTEQDPMYSSLKERLRCQNCGIYFDFANKPEHYNKLFMALESPPKPELTA